MIPLSHSDRNIVIKMVICRMRIYLYIYLAPFDLAVRTREKISRLLRLRSLLGRRRGRQSLRCAWFILAAATSLPFTFGIIRLRFIDSRSSRSTRRSFGCASFQDLFLCPKKGRRVKHTIFIIILLRLILAELIMPLLLFRSCSTFLSLSALDGLDLLPFLT